MRKFVFLLTIIFVCLFVAGCAHDYVSYCPYCSSRSITKVEDGIYKCENSACGRTFGARELKQPEAEELD